MSIEEQAWMEAREAWLADTTAPKYTSPHAWVSGYAAALIAKSTKARPWVHEIIDAAVESFDLGPEDQDCVLRFGMKLQDMEDAIERHSDECKEQ